MKEKRISSKERRDQIIDVAMKLFSKKGFNGTTVRNIAKEADICEAMLYKHFDAKESLYAAILEKQCEEKGTLLSLNDEGSPETDEHSRLKSVAAEIITAISDDTTFMRLFLFSCLEGHELSDTFFKNRILKSLEALAAYLKLRMEQGHFKPLNPKLAARAFIGMIIHYVMVQELYGGKRVETFELDEVVDTFTTLFLRGIEQNCTDS